MEHFLIHGVFGSCAEILWTACHNFVTGYRVDPADPIHNALRHHPWLLRGLVWMVLIFVIEYLSGWLLRRLTGRCPWDYACVSTNIHGLVRLDYAPLRFIFGLLLEHLHDTLARIV